MKTPIAIISGYLGSGKTTLLQHIIKNLDRKFAILMNEFGEVSIDTKIVEGKNVDIAELTDGCVCCSLTGEFEEAIKEIIEKYQPEIIIVETTGVAEPDAIVVDISEELPQVQLDTVITVVDADALVRFPSLSKIGQTQIEMADVILLNKVDLVDEDSLNKVKEKVQKINDRAKMFETVKGEVDIDLLFGIEVEHKVKHAHKNDKSDIESFVFKPKRKYGKKEMETILHSLPSQVYRLKGFVNIDGTTCLVQYVAGRFEIQEQPSEKLQLVVIGEKLDKEETIKLLS